MAEELNTQVTTEKQDHEGETNIIAPKKGDLVKGTIVKIDDNQVYVSVGYKYEGTIPFRELSSVNLERITDAVEIGQEINAKIISFNDEKELLVLSKRQADALQAWEDLQAKFTNNEVFEVTVTEVVKGGLVTNVGVRGFIPASMVELHFVEDFSDYKGRSLKVKVKEIDRENNKVILSAKEVLEEQQEAKRQELITTFKVGQQLQGKVQRLTPFGAFVDLGGVDGLIHVSEMAWHHVTHPGDIVHEGEDVQVKVLKVDPKIGKVSLSLKATQPSPWEIALGKLKAGDVITGTIKRLVNFGAFVEIWPGVEGLVHISQIAHRHLETPHEVLKEGQEVQVKVLDFNVEEKRISLSIKEMLEREAKPASENRASRPSRVETAIAPTESMSFNLGERLGDKLSKFK